MYQNPFLDPFTAFSERLGANYDDMRKGPLDKQYVSSQVYQPIDLAGRAVLSGIYSGIKSIVDPTVPLVSGNVKGPLPGNKMSSKEKKGNHSVRLVRNRDVLGVSRLILKESPRRK